MIVEALSILLPTSIISVLSSWGAAKAEMRKGFLCRDVHKAEPIYVPCSVGIALLLPIAVGLGVATALGTIPWRYSVAIVLSLAIAGVVGIVDDVRGLSPRAKIALGLLPAIPILAMRTYVPRPWVPFMGFARMYIVYPLLVLAAYTVFCNGANMIDTHNGLLVGNVLALLGFSAALSALLGAPHSYLWIQMTLLSAIIPYAVLNAYPARVFNGNAGSFILGAVMASCAITCRLEAFYVLGNLVMFINGWLYLVSAGGFLQKERVKRPVTMSGDEMKPSCEPDAPVTFTRLALVLMGGADEKRYVAAVLSTVVANCFLASAALVLLGFRFG